MIIFFREIEIYHFHDFFFGWDHFYDFIMHAFYIAGMRLIETDQQEAIMRNVRQGIQSHFQFQFPDSNLEIISGTQEGIYQWLAINYVLNRFETKGTLYSNVKKF